MAVKLDVARASHKTEETEVASCVSGIIEAFTNGLNIFKRLRERRRKRKARRENQVPDPTSSAESQLSKSLKKGPQDLAERYAECYYGGMGPKFAKGDAIAHASLAETLIKLNTGLVGIITTFLNHDSKSGKSHMDLDYKSLTNLSDASRREALQSMTQLYQRLSHSQPQLYSISAPPCPRCGTSKHHDCSSRSTSPEKEKKKHSSSRQRSSGPVVTRMPTRSSSHPQLVVVRPVARPKTTRKGSSSSNNSSSTKSPPGSGYTSPLTSPQLKKASMAPQLPMYVPVEPFELSSSGIIKGTLGGPNIGRLRIDSFDDPRPSTWPAQTYSATPLKHHHDPTPKLPTFTPTLRRPSHSSNHQQSKPSIPSKPAHLSSSTPPMSPLPFRRRMDKVTPSSYTFASDSTKLGEIPQRHWTRPYDYGEAERLNAEAAVNGYPNAPVAAEEKTEKTEKKKRRFGFLRRGSGAVIMS